MRVWSRRYSGTILARKPLRSITILLTSRQVYHEASNVLYKIGKLHFGTSSPTRRNVQKIDLTGVDLVPLTSFCQVHIECGIYDCHVEYGKSSVNGAGKKLARMVDALGKAQKESSGALSRKLHLKFESMNTWYNRSFERIMSSSQLSFRTTIWYYIQLLAAVGEMRNKLAVLSFGTILTTNLDDHELSGVSTKRVSACLVRWRSSKFREQGSLSINPKLSGKEIEISYDDEYNPDEPL